MKGHYYPLGRLPTKVFRFSAMLAIATLAVLPIPAFAQKADLKTPSNLASQTLLKQQPKGHWIEIDLSDQRLSAWNGKTLVRAFMVSTGKQSTPTPVGTYAIQSKFSSTQMRGEDYNVPDVPYAMFFTGGYAIHGAYWHHSFGTPISHGCINMQVPSARWLYSWAPEGTPVIIHQ